MTKFSNVTNCNHSRLQPNKCDPDFGHIISLVYFSIGTKGTVFYFEV